MGDAALWAAVLALGAWHGLNPAMGWPLALAAGLAQRRDAAVFATALPLAAGHFLAMAALLLPFAAAGAALGWSRELRFAAGALVLAFGLLRLARRGHPRALARVPPTRLAAWSFLMAGAHGAPLMLLPFAPALCAPAAGAAEPLAAVAGAAGVAAAHTLALLAAGQAMAWCAYRLAGPGLVKRGWIDLDAAWGAGLVLAGVACLVAVPR